MSSKQGPDIVTPDRFSLRRWSRRKLDSAREAQGSGRLAEAAAAEPPKALPGDATVAATPAGATSPPVELPPIESLTFESDFSVFFQPQVHESLKRAALKQLFRDPRFNVMDGLDIYVGDYTKSDPIPDHIIQQLVQARAIFNPPRTMLAPEGYVVDVPPENAALPADAAVAAPGDPVTAALADDSSVPPSVVPGVLPSAPVARSIAEPDVPDTAKASPHSAFPAAHSSDNTTAKP